MKKILCALALATPGLTFADIIKCTFTEPFYTTTYSMAQQSLTVQGISGGTTITRNVSFQIMAAGRFEIRSLSGTVLQRLTLNNRGSDGMSDRVYPYSVRWRGLQGGCTSNFLHAR